jgi:TRAP-type transport system periplasmic protein
MTTRRDTRQELAATRRSFLKAGLGTLSILGAGGLSRRATAASSGPIKARLGHGQAATHPAQLASVRFAELVKERSRGRLEISVHPSSQLGSTAEMVEGIRMGTIELHMAGDAFLEGIAPKVSLVNLPGILRDDAHAYKVMYSLMLRDVYEASLLPLGVRPLGFVSADFRHFTNNRRPLKSLADMKGLKIRVPNSKVAIDIVKALGASPVPIDWTETFGALQQGVVDGQENPLVQIHAAKFYEIQKHLALTRHQWAAFALVANEKFFQGLDPELQKIVLASGKDAADYGWQEGVKRGTELLGQLKNLGMLVTEIDGKEIQTAVKPVWNTWIERIGADGKGLIQRVLDL